MIFPSFSSISLSGSSSSSSSAFDLAAAPMAVVSAEAQFHVLAVDDSLVDRKLIERLLKTSSFNVTAVDSGSKALELLGLVRERNESNPSSVASENHRHLSHHQEIEVNLIITDYCMPEMTGYDLLRKIKESDSLKDIPVVIMSSENVPARINRCLEEGAEEFLLKPVKLSDVNKLKPFICRGKGKEMESTNLKRKEMDQTHSSERTRTKYNDHS